MIRTMVMSGPSVSETCMQGHIRHTVDNMQAEHATSSNNTVWHAACRRSPSRRGKLAVAKVLLIVVAAKGGRNAAPRHEAGFWMRGRRHHEGRRSAEPDQAQRRHMLAPQLHSPWPSHEEPMPLESAGPPRSGQEVLVQLFILAAVLPTAVNAVHDVQSWSGY